MTTYSSLVTASGALAKLFKVLGVIFAVFTVICIILAVSFPQYIHLDISRHNEDYDAVTFAAQAYFYVPAIFSLLLTIVSFAVSKITNDLCVNVPLEKNK